MTQTISCEVATKVGTLDPVGQGFFIIKKLSKLSVIRVNKGIVQGRPWLIAQNKSASHFCEAEMGGSMGRKLFFIFI